MKHIIILFALLIAATTTPLQAKNKKSKLATIDISMFPKAKPGYKMLYIQVPATKQENNLKVEFFVGRNEQVDCNKYFLTGDIKEQNLEGWGYTYYTVESDGNIAGTKMACPDNVLQTKFVHLQGEITRYNSKLPIVLYIPEKLDVQYRIWKADKKMQHAK